MNILPRKINVLEMHSALGVGGAERNMITFCKFLNKELFNVFVVSYQKGGLLELRLKELGIDFMVSNSDIGKILKFTYDKNIDVLHIHRSGHYIELESKIINGLKKQNPRL